VRILQYGESDGEGRKAGVHEDDASRQGGRAPMQPGVLARLRRSRSPTLARRKMFPKQLHETFLRCPRREEAPIPAITVHNVDEARMIESGPRRLGIEHLERERGSADRLRIPPEADEPRVRTSCGAV
jgi:hypothetical protein